MAQDAPVNTVKQVESDAEEDREGAPLNIKNMRLKRTWMMRMIPNAKSVFALTRPKRCCSVIHVIAVGTFSVSLLLLNRYRQVSGSAQCASDKDNSERAAGVGGRCGGMFSRFGFANEHPAKRHTNKFWTTGPIGICCRVPLVSAGSRLHLLIVVNGQPDSTSFIRQGFDAAVTRA